MPNLFKDGLFNKWVNTTDNSWIKAVTKVKNHFLESYHVSAIPKKFVEGYGLIEERSSFVPEGWVRGKRLRLSVDKDKISSDESGFMALVRLDQQALFDVVKNPRPYPRFNNSASKYISPTGSDELGNGTLEAPYKTLNKAVTSGTGSTYCVFLPGIHQAGAYTDSRDRTIYIESYTGDYRDVIIVTDSIDTWFMGGEGNYIYIRNVTIEDYTINSCFGSNSGRTYLEHVFYTYKGNNTNHYLCGGSSNYYTIFYIYNCTLDFGVQTYSMYYAHVAHVHNTICNIDPVNYTSGNHPYNCCYPNPDVGYNNIDRDIYPPDFVTGAVIPYSSPCRGAGVDTYQSHYEGDTPSIGCHDVGGPYSRLMFHDAFGNKLSLEFIEWDDVDNYGTFYLRGDFDSLETTNLFAYYSDVPMQDAGGFVVASDIAAVLFECDQSDTYSNYQNTRSIMKNWGMAQSGNAIRIKLKKHPTYDYFLAGCFVGHAGASAPDFDGGQKRITFNGGSHSVDVTVDNIVSDVIEFDLDSSRDLIFSFYTTSGKLGIQAISNDSAGVWRGSSTLDQSALTDVSYSVCHTADWSAGVRYLEVYPVVASYWETYSLVLHGSLRDTGDALDSRLPGDITTSPTFDENYIINTPFGPGLNLAQSAVAHLIAGDVFDKTAGTLVVVFKNSNSTLTQVFFATPASATTNQHTFELTTSGAIQITDAGGTASITTNAGFNDGEYHTAIITWDATGRKIEVDKVDQIISNPTATFATDPSSAVGLIGYDYVSKDAATDSFDGIIGEFRVAKSALSSDTVQVIGYSETDTLFDGTLATATRIEESYGAGSVSTWKELSWIIAKAINNPQFWEEPWVIMQPPVLAVFEETWGIKLLNTFTELYGDVAVAKGIFVEWYGDGVIAKNTFVERYGDAKVRKASYSLLWMIYSNPKMFITEEWGITGTTVTKVIEELWNLEGMNKVGMHKTMPYHLLSEESISSTPEAEVTIYPPEAGDGGSGWLGGDMGDGSVLEQLSISVEGGLDQYCLSGDFSLGSAAQYLLCEYLSHVSVEIGGTTFEFFVESRTQRTTNSGSVYSVGLLSETAKLDSPYADTLVDCLPNGAMAKQLVIDMAATANIDIDWQLKDQGGDEINWSIPGPVISINDETPLEVIRKVVNSIGGIVQTKPDGTLLLISEYPISTRLWDTATTVRTLSTDADILSINESLDIRGGFNAFIITDQGSSAEMVSLEEVNIDRQTKLVRGYQVPFDVAVPLTLKTSSPDVATIVPRTNPVRLVIPDIDISDLSLTESDEWELVEFIDWAGKTSRPILLDGNPNHAVEVRWLTNDLGGLTMSEDGTLTVTNTDNVPSESLLWIKYWTQFWEWTVTAPDVHPIQVFIAEIGEDGDVC